MYPDRLLDLRWQSTVSVFNMLSRLVIAFLPRKKCLNSTQQSSPEVILEHPKIKSPTVSIVSPSVGHEAMELEAMILICFHSFILVGG